MSNKTSKKKSTGADEPKKNVFTVEKVLDKRAGRGGREEYYIKWQGFSAEDCTWEPRENLQCPTMVDEFEKEHAKRERPSRKQPKAPAAEEAGEEVEVPADPNDKFSLNGKQLKCIVGLTKGPGELHFLCRFTDDTARLLPSKEVNSRYRPYVDEYGKFLQRNVERKQRKADDGEEEEEWPRTPPRDVLLAFERERNNRLGLEEGEQMEEEVKDEEMKEEEMKEDEVKEEEVKEEEMKEEDISSQDLGMSPGPEMTQTPTPTDLLREIQSSESSELLSSCPPGSSEDNGEASNMSDSVLAAFADDDRIDGMPDMGAVRSSIIIDRLPNDDDDDFII